MTSNTIRVTCHPPHLFFKMICNELDDHPDPDDEMWAAMKDSGASIATTAFNELGMGHGNPVVFKALERGIKCGLGTVRVHFTD